jgi:hypothetical protein
MEVSRQLHALAVLLWGESEPGARWVEGEVVWTLRSTEKSSCPAGNRTSDLQPIARCYTD